MSNNIQENVLETDVLVVGGGIAGCCAAAKAAESGLKVMMVEKSKSDRSGSSGQGIDHYSGFFPPGTTPQQFLEIWKNMGPGAFFGGAEFINFSRLYRTIVNRRWASDELERFGVPMKWEHGDYEVADIYYHGGWTTLRVHWMNVKPILAKAVRERGVKVLERTMAVDLLTDKNRVTGITALNTRTGDFSVIKAKATVLATASFSRCFNPETPQPWKYKYRYHWCPAAVSGDGWAMTFRAGGEIGNMEQTERGYRFRDDLTLSYGNVRGDGIEAKRLTWDGTETRLAGVALERQGKDPFYYSLTNLPDDFQKRIEVAYADERLVSFKIAEDRGFNPRTHNYEMMENRPNQLNTPPGITADVNFQSTLPGLYAVGDCLSGTHNVAAAAVTGLIVGKELYNSVNKIGEPKINQNQVEEQKETVYKPMSVKDGTNYVELETSIRYAVDRYISSFKAEGKIREGIRRVASLKREFLPKLSAENPHHLMRCLEVRNIIEMAELHFQASLDRKESRGNFTRLDYPKIDNKYDGLLLNQRLVNGKPVIEWKKPEPMDMSLREEAN